MFDSPLQTVASLAQIIGAGTIVTAVIFGSYQIKEYRKRRENMVAMEMMRSFYNADLARAISLVRLLPDSVSATALRDKGSEYEQAAILVTTTFETMGLLAYRRIAHFSLVQELAGGLIIVSWHKLSEWLATVREEQNQPSWAEWFQWLAERMIETKTQSEPAYLRYKNWTP